MSDRSYVEIKIGGKISPSNLDLLNQLALEEGCEIVTDGFYAEQAPEGRLPDLEALCRELGLTYAVYQVGCIGSYPPTITYWKPGMGEARVWNASFEGRPCLEIDDIIARQVQNTLDAELALMMEVRNIPALTLKDDES